MSRLEKVQNLLAQINADYALLEKHRDMLSADCDRIYEQIQLELSSTEALSREVEKIRADMLERQRSMYGEQAQMPLVPAGVIETDCNPEVLVAEETLPCQLRLKLFVSIAETSTICSCKFSPNSEYLAVGGNLGLRVYDIESDSFAIEYKFEYKRSDNYVRALCWTRDSHYFIAGNEDHNVYVFDLRRKTLVRQFEVSGPIFALESDAVYLYAASGAGEVTIWGIKNYEKVRTLKRLNDSASATSLSMGSDGKFLAVGYNDGTVTIWNIWNGSVACQKLAHDDGVYCLRFFREGNCLATGSFDGKVKLWRVAESRKGFELCKTLNDHSSYVLSLCLTPDESMLISSSKDKSVIFTDLANEMMIYRITEHKDTVLAVDVSNNGTMLVTGGGDMAVYVWKITVRKP